MRGRAPALYGVAMDVRSSRWFVAALIALSPFVGEFLLGNLTLRELPLGVFLAPMYGLGAVLVREVTRRSGGGWPAIFLLAAAYALIEEGLVDQLLWNDSYADHDYLHGPSYIPMVGTSVEAVQTILALHIVWSICVPIAIIERLAGRRGTTPWLTTRGTTFVGAAFFVSIILIGIAGYSEEQFLASPAQLIGCSVVIVALILAAFRVRGHRFATRPAQAPRPFVVGAVTLATTSAYWGPAVLVSRESYEWFGVVIWLAVGLGGGWWLLRSSRSVGWGSTHRFAAAAGATLTYAWASFPVVPEAYHPSRALDLTSNAVFGLVALAILVTAAQVGSPRNSLPTLRA
ncbi:MAG: hypothetical protein QOJ72_220 [Nocardioidaceae bacterium]|nr:hypothetical protein [Nocardioidaceae bacterium]